MELFLLDEAAARFRAMIRARPRLAAAHYNLGLVYSRQGLHDGAAAELRAAIDGGLGPPTAWNNLGTALAGSAQHASAAQAYREALRLDPRHCHAAINLGRLYLALGERETARETFARARDQACEPGLQRLIQRCLGGITDQ